MTLGAVEERIVKAKKRALLDYALWGESYVHIYLDEVGEFHIDNLNPIEGKKLKEKMSGTV